MSNLKEFERNLGKRFHKIGEDLQIKAAIAIPQIADYLPHINKRNIRNAFLQGLVGLGTLAGAAPLVKAQESPNPIVQQVSDGLQLQDISSLPPDASTILTEPNEQTGDKTKITSKSLLEAFSIGGNGDIDMTTPIPIPGQNKQVSMKDIMAYASKTWNIEISEKTIAGNPLIIIQLLHSMGAYAGINNGPVKYSIFPEAPVLHRFTLDVLADNKPAELPLNVPPGFSLRQGAHLNILGVGVSESGAGPQIVAAADVFSPQSDYPQLYLTTISVNEFTKLVKANKGNFDWNKGELTFPDGKKVTLNTIADTNLMNNVDRATGAMFVKDFMGKPVKNNIVPFPPMEGLTVKLVKEIGYIWALDVKGNAVMQAVYDKNTNSWDWIKLLTPVEVNAEITPFAKARGMKVEDVKPGQLYAEDFQGNPYIKFVTADGTVLKCAAKNKEGKYEWQSILMPGIPFAPQNMVNDGYKKFNLPSPVEAKYLKYDVRQNLNSADKHPIVFARDPKNNEIVMATRLYPDAKEYKWYVAGLRDLADASGWRIGTNLSTPYFTRDVMDQQDALVIQEFNHAMLQTFDWWNIQKYEGSFTFIKAENAVDLAKINGMTIEGDNPMFPPSIIKSTFLKDFVEIAKKQNLTKEQMRQKLIDIMVNHITTLLTQFKGKVNQYPIVVEAKENDPVRDMFWAIIGPEYIDIAFDVARKVDPDTRLFYNESNNERRGGRWGYNYSITKTIVDRLKSKGLVDAVGVEMHLNAANPVSKQELIETLRSYGLPVIISSVDINLKDIQGSKEERYALQAQILKDAFEAAVESGVCKEFSFWEASGDKYNWLERNNGEINADPTIFDDNLNPKPAYFALKRSLQNIVDKQK